eukprot:TRINITY_DN9492_c0_g3_i1.p1 TRINITY_DN9492_c0_g3~~TRINITY_DN9492_c0_g3_i1.p1  ORF type:complete len:298 (+),score=44.68 TRINITY_DN9492_c0_g3_i1:58-951(+)
MTGQTATINRKTHHPLAARIKRLMQADDGIGKIAQGTPLAISKAVELLLLEISYEGIRVAQREGVRTVGVRQLGQVPKAAPEFSFLSCLNSQFVQEGAGEEKIKHEGKKRKGGEQGDGNFRLNNTNSVVNVGKKRKKHRKEKNISSNQSAKINNKKILDEPIVLDDGEEDDDDVVFVNAIYSNNAKKQQDNNKINSNKISQNGNNRYNNIAQISKQQSQQQQQQQQQNCQKSQEIEQIQLQQQFSYKQYHNSNIIKQPQQQQYYQAPSFQQLQTISGISSLGQSGGLYDDEDDYDNL